MKFQPRKTIQLPQDQYIGRRIYFVTICCENRRALFANPSNASALLQDLISISQRMDFLLHAYCVMPDHLHILVEGRFTESDLHLYVTKLKQKTGYSLRAAAEGDLWQKRYYDHILRKAEDSDSIAWYIWMNPVRQRLVSKPEQYPFSGSFTVDWPPTGSMPKDWTHLGRASPSKPSVCPSTYSGTCLGSCRVVLQRDLLFTLGLILGLNLVRFGERRLPRVVPLT